MQIHQNQLAVYPCLTVCHTCLQSGSEESDNSFIIILKVPLYLLVPVYWLFSLLLMWL